MDPKEVAEHDSEPTHLLTHSLAKMQNLNIFIFLKLSHKDRIIFRMLLRQHLCSVSINKREMKTPLNVAFSPGAIQYAKCCCNKVYDQNNHIITMILYFGVTFAYLSL